MEARIRSFSVSSQQVSGTRRYKHEPSAQAGGFSIPIAFGELGRRSAQAQLEGPAIQVDTAGNKAPMPQPLFIRFLQPLMSKNLIHVRPSTNAQVRLRGCGRVWIRFLFSSFPSLVGCTRDSSKSLII